MLGYLQQSNFPTCRAPCERLFVLYAHSLPLPPLQVRIIRIFNTYGPRMALDDGRVVSNFVAQARNAHLQMVL